MRRRPQGRRHLCAGPARNQRRAISDAPSATRRRRRARCRNHVAHNNVQSDRHLVPPCPARTGDAFCPARAAPHTPPGRAPLGHIFLRPCRPRAPSSPPRNVQRPRGLVGTLLLPGPNSVTVRALTPVMRTGAVPLPAGLWRTPCGWCGRAVQHAVAGPAPWTKAIRELREGGCGRAGRAECLFPHHVRRPTVRVHLTPANDNRVENRVPNTTLLSASTAQVL